MLTIYNSMTRQKEAFKPLHENMVGMYVCGPTVYGDGHLGHARPAITFDIVFRYLTHLGYKVRYVRNDGVVLELTPEDVVIDLNHPLAQDKVRFEGEVLVVRDPTDDELHPKHGCCCGGGDCGSGDCGDHSCGEGGCCGGC